MLELRKNELLEISGGVVKLTATLFGYLLKGASLVFEFGQSFGSSVRRIFTNTTCPI